VLRGLGPEPGRFGRDLPDIPIDAVDPGLEVGCAQEPDPLASAVEDYRVRYIRTDESEAEEQVTILAGEPPRALLEDVLEGSDIGVKAINREGLEGWDWV